MPRIPPIVLDCVCYLYASEEDAQQGADFGGTGFLVSMPSRFPDQGFVYVVTNWHVACRDGHSVVRLNTREGDPATFDFGPEQWEFDPRYDIAVRLIGLREDHHRFCVVSAPDGLVSREKIESEKIGPGDDVFMVGRFIDHDGGTTNRPSVRFGNISVMPSAIAQPDRGMADAYCIELHSRSGYSGSPVFIYRMPGYDLEQAPLEEGGDLARAKILLAGRNYLALLGIHFAHFPEMWELFNPTSAPQANAAPLIREGAYVKGLSGMTCVLPAWTILDVLNMAHLKAARDRVDDIEEERRDREGHPPEPEREVPSAEAAKSGPDE